jgi:hypothetical protein
MMSNAKIFITHSAIWNGGITCTILQTLLKAGPLRSLIIPRQGYRFVIADYSQFEARIALGLSQDKHGLAIF